MQANNARAVPTRSRILLLQARGDSVQIRLCLLQGDVWLEPRNYAKKCGLTYREHVNGGIERPIRYSLRGLSQIWHSLISLVSWKPRKYVQDAYTRQFKDQRSLRAGRVQFLLLRSGSISEKSIGPSTCQILSRQLCLLWSSAVFQDEILSHSSLAGRVAEVLNHQRPLTLPMIRRLHQRLGIPAEVLVGESVAA